MTPTLLILACLDYDPRFALGFVMSLTVSNLQDGLRNACQPTFVPYIERGRAQVLAMPRRWVLDNVRDAASVALDLTDEWEYRRLLELLELLDAKDVLEHFVSYGFKSDDPDVREAAEDFAAKNNPSSKP